MYNNDNYVFISYAHKDSEKVIPIINSLKERGFNVWYDSGIEAGTEWPEYIAEKLMGSEVVIAFISENSVNSPNCRREINFAIEINKELLVIYLEDLKLTPGMRMQLNSLQAMFRSRSKNTEDFIDALSRSAILQSCLTAPEPLQKSKQNEDTSHKLDTEKESSVKKSNISEAQKSLSAEQYLQEINKDLKENRPKITKEDIDKGFIIYKNICQYRETDFGSAELKLKIHMNRKQMLNAVSYIAKDVSPKDVIAILDTSVLKNGKEGFLFTKKAVYMLRYKERLSLNYNEIESVYSDSIYLYVNYLDGSNVKYSAHIEVLGKILNTIVEEQRIFDNNPIPELSSVTIAVREANSKVLNGFTFKRQLTEKQISNAIKTYAQDVKENEIIAINDFTISKNGKEGWLITETSVYSNTFKKTNPIVFDRLQSVEAIDGHMIINFKDGEKQKILGGASLRRETYDFLDILINKK